ncbi:MAG: hydrogenase formation protein HypD, partial [Gammaproteobacteria bacterium]
MSQTARHWLTRINELPLPQPLAIMNVCGGHERAITQAGLRSLLPEGITLIPGPGCPVCICPEEDIYAVMQLALHETVTVLSFGDMLRVPVNNRKGSPRSLEQARACGADIRPIASPLEAVRIARAQPNIRTILFAVGFETTTAPIAAMIHEGLPDNLYIYSSARLTWPAVALLLNSGRPGFDALIAPGHVATVMGARQWQFVVEQHQLPAAVAGFQAESLLAAIYSVMRQSLEQQPFLDNCYAEVVKDEGNLHAQTLLDRVFDIRAAQWRGIGEIDHSGYQLKDCYAAHDAQRQFAIDQNTSRKRFGQMPAGCDCAEVVLGRKRPDQCRLYNDACTPDSPIGPCMVSDEGACHI